MSSLVACLLTLRLHLNNCDIDSRPLFLVSLFLSLYIHIHIHILLLLLYTGTDKTGTSLSSSTSDTIVTLYSTSDTIVTLYRHRSTNRFVSLNEGTGTRPDYLVNRVLTKNEGPYPKKFVPKSRNCCKVNSGGVGAHGQLTRSSNGLSPEINTNAQRILVMSHSLSSAWHLLASNFWGLQLILLFVFKIEGRTDNIDYAFFLGMSS